MASLWQVRLHWRKHWQSWQHRLGQSLRTRLALGLAVPLFLVLGAIAVGNYWRQQHLLTEQAQLTARQVGQVVASSLYAAFQRNDPAQLSDLLTNLRATRTLARLQITDLDGVIKLDSAVADSSVKHIAEPGCTDCHRFAAGNRPKAAVLSTNATFVRVAVPLDNSPECQACHPASVFHLGIALIDLPMQIVGPHTVANLQTDLALSVGLTLGLVLLVYFLMSRLVVQRVEAFRRPLAAYAAGDFAVRLPTETTPDEIGALAQTFNHMADRIAAQTQAEQEQQAVRHRAIVEERERIARELHDGLAQVLGYVHTKATAVRLLLKKGQGASAEKQLLQLEEAARAVFVDVREAILGLRLTSQRSLGLGQMVNDYAAQFSRLSDLPVAVRITPHTEQLQLPAEVEVQLLRIMQEALSNVRKHAQASAVEVVVQNGGPHLALEVHDNGRGFDPLQARPNGRPHFGLSTMRERAEAIGAMFAVHSQLGQGTQVQVRLALKRE